MQQRTLRLRRSYVESVIPPRQGSGGEDRTSLVAAMQSLVTTREPIALEIIGTAHERRFLLRAKRRPSLLHAQRQLRARLPQAGFVPLDPCDDPLQLRPGEVLSALELKAGAASYLPLQSWDEQELVGNDPVLGILAALDALPEGTRAIAQLTLVPAPPNWSRMYQRKAIEHALEPERTETMQAQKSGGRGPGWGKLLFGGIILVLLLLYKQYRQVIPAWVFPAFGPLLHGTILHLTSVQQVPFLEVLALLAAAALMFVLLDQCRRRLFTKPVYDMRLVGQKTSRMAYRVRLRLYTIGPGVPRTPSSHRKRRSKLRRRLNRRLWWVRRQRRSIERPVLPPIDGQHPWMRRLWQSVLRCMHLIWLYSIYGMRLLWYNGITVLLGRWIQAQLTVRLIIRALRTLGIRGLLGTGWARCVNGWQRWRTTRQLRQQRRETLDRLVAAYRQFHLASGNYFVPHRLTKGAARRCMTTWWRGVNASPHFISVESVADLWHLPTPEALPELAFVEQKQARTLLLSPRLAAAAREPGATLLGTSVHAGHDVRFALPESCRGQHMLIAGKSGEGKSTCMEHLARAAMEQGGLVVIDPHGDLVDHLLQRVPEHRVEDVVLIDLSDPDYALGLNPLDATMGRGRDKTVADVLKTLAHIWSSSWGPRMENAFEFALRTLYEANRYLVEHDLLNGRNRQYTLLDVMFVLTDESFCHALLEHIEDPFIHRWWQIYFDPLSLTMQRDRIDPVISKSAKFESEIARRIVGQSHSTINFAQYIQEEKIILVKLAKGVVGEDVARLLGATLLGLLQTALEEQGSLHATARKQLPIMIDEFQTLKGVDWSALAELRKYGAAFYLATQSLEYLREQEQMLPMVLANVKQYFIFCLAAQDAETIHQEIGVELEDIVNLESHMCYVKLTYANRRQPPFSLHITPPLAMAAGQRERVRQIRERNRRFMRPAAMVDAHITEHMIRVLALHPKEDEARSSTVTREQEDETRGLGRQQGGNRGRKSQEKRASKDGRPGDQRGQTPSMHWTETVGALPSSVTVAPAVPDAQERDLEQKEAIEGLTEGPDDGQNA